MATEFDIIVIGAGIAGASVAARLSETHRVVIVEMEERPAYHTTGRSAAAYEPNYGPAPICALTRASRGDFDAGNYLTPRDNIFFMPEGQEADFEHLMANQKGMHEITIAEAKSRYPMLREGYARRAVRDPGAADIDVDLLHQNFMRHFKSNGGEILCNAAVMGLSHDAGWTVAAGPHTLRARTIVNAAGAWGDKVGVLAGCMPLGLQPKRRSMAVVPAPEGMDITHWAHVGDVGETWYCKPQSGKLLVSPADTTPVDPHDAYADDMALAEGIDRLQQATHIEVNRVEHTWGGLRSFVPDGSPAVGYDKTVDGFFWLVGQGGYGIQTSPALSRLAASMVRREAVPQDIADEGLVLADIAPERFI